MKNILIVFALLFGLKTEAQINNSKEITTNPTMHNVGFITLLTHYYEDGLKLNPLNATFQGDYRYNDILPNFLSSDYKKEMKNYYSSYLDKSKKFEKAKLSESERMSYAILKWECEINLESLEFENYTPIDQMWSMNLMIGQLAGGSSAQPFKTVEDYDNWLERLDDYVVWLKSTKTQMEVGMKAKNVLPKSLIIKVLPQLASVADTELESNLFYTPIHNFPIEFTESEQARLTSDYTTLITNKIIPTYKELHDFMANEYMNAGRESSGIQDVPNGDAYYAHQIKLYTTTILNASEIHEIGLKEVARISSEMEKVKEQVGFTGNLKDFFKEVRTKKELMPFTDPQQVIDNFNDIHKKMTPKINALFSKQPKTTFEVRRTEAFREASASAEYKIGQLKIMELRSKAEARFGKDFDIKLFHEKILETGCVPLAILEDKMMNWINPNTKF